MSYAKCYSTNWKAIALSVVTLAGQHDASQYTLECLCAMNDSEVKTKLPNIKNSLEHMSTMSENERFVVISIALLEYNNQKRQVALEQKSMDLRAREEARSKHSGKLKLSAVADGNPSPIKLCSPGWVLVYSSWSASYWLECGQTFSLRYNLIKFKLKFNWPYQTCRWGTSSALVIQSDSRFKELYVWMAKILHICDLSKSEWWRCALHSCCNARNIPLAEVEKGFQSYSGVLLLQSAFEVDAHLNWTHHCPHMPQRLRYTLIDGLVSWQLTQWRCTPQAKQSDDKTHVIEDSPVIGLKPQSLMWEQRNQSPDSEPDEGRDMRIAIWEPPPSQHYLIEEMLYNDPWRLLTACMLLNKTAGSQVSLSIPTAFKWTS